MRDLQPRAAAAGLFEMVDMASVMPIGDDGARLTVSVDDLQNTFDELSQAGHSVTTHTPAANASLPPPASALRPRPLRALDRPSARAVCAAAALRGGAGHARPEHHKPRRAGRGRRRGTAEGAAANLLPPTPPAPCL